MRKTLTAAMAAITLGGALCATAAPVQAREWRGGYGGYHHHDRDGGAAIAAGVVGLALGAALASNNHGYYGHSYYYDRPYYGGYYDEGYYAPAYRVCESTRWVWDPYVGHRVPVRERYAC